MKQQGRISINIQTGSADLCRHAAQLSAVADESLFWRQEETLEQNVRLCWKLFLDPLQLKSKFILNLISTIRDAQNTATVHTLISCVCELFTCTQGRIRDLATIQPT